MEAGGKNLEWISELTILRGIAVLSVIVIHVTALLTSIEYGYFLVATNYFLHYLTSFAVPLFVAISGASLSYKYFDSFSLIDFYKKRFKSIVPQYIMFSILYLLILETESKL